MPQHASVVSNYVLACRDPLHQDPLREPYPKDYKISRVTPYNGATDPMNHINRFLHQMESQTMQEDTLCYVFLGNLDGVSYRRFSDQKPRSIINLRDLCRKFKEQHVAN